MTDQIDIEEMIEEKNQVGDVYLLRLTFPQNGIHHLMIMDISSCPMVLSLYIMM